MAALAPRAEAATGRVIARIARALALCGGVILCAIAGMVVVSILGRQFDGLWVFGPIRGDYELVEAGTAIAVFAFLPWCQINRGHVSVDLVARRLPVRLGAVLAFIAEALIAAVAFVIVWRLYLGFGEKFPYGGDAVRGAFGLGPRPFFAETTYELEIASWIPYAASLVGAALFFVTALYTVWRAFNGMLAGREALS